MIAFADVFESMSNDDLVKLYDELGLELEDMDVGSYSYDCVSLELMEVYEELTSREIKF